jgi:CheY-like chemotaxis protein
MDEKYGKADGVEEEAGRQKDEMPLDDSDSAHSAASDDDPGQWLAPEWRAYVNRAADRVSKSQTQALSASQRKRRRITRILVVDDDPEVCELLGLALQEAGFVCDVAGGGAEALSMAERRAYDLVVADLVMPDIGGLDVIRELRRRRDETRAIIIAGKGETESAIEALRARADDFILKPLDIAEVLASVQRALKRQDAMRGIRLSHQQLCQQLANLNLKLQRRFAGGRKACPSERRGAT